MEDEMKGRLYRRWNEGKEDCMEDGMKRRKILWNMEWRKKWLSVRWDKVKMERREEKLYGRLIEDAWREDSLKWNKVMIIWKMKWEKGRVLKNAPPLIKNFAFKVDPLILDSQNQAKNISWVSRVPQSKFEGDQSKLWSEKQTISCNAINNFGPIPAFRKKVIHSEFVDWFPFSSTRFPIFLVRFRFSEKVNKN